MKLKQLLTEDITHAEAIKIANSKLKSLGIKSINEFNGGWGASYSAKPFEQPIKIPNELKSFVRTMIQYTTVSGDLGYHSTYNSNPGIRIISYVSGWTIKETEKGMGYSYTLGSIEWEYKLSTKKWLEIK